MRFNGFARSGLFGAWKLVCSGTMAECRDTLSLIVSRSDAAVLPAGQTPVCERPPNIKVGQGRGRVRDEEDDGVGEIVGEKEQGPARRSGVGRHQWDKSDSASPPRITLPKPSKAEQERMR